MKIRIMKSKNRKEMEQDIDMFSEDERQVAQILVDDLPRLIFHLKGTVLPLPLTWGCKRMRSAIQVTPAATQCAAPPPLHHGGAVVTPPFKAPSPATPPSLSLTESDDKTKKPLRLKASLKRKREYYLKIIEDLTKSKASLNQELDNVKRHGDQLRAFNLKLKERKQELNYNKIESKNPSLVNASVNSSNSMAENQGQQLQLQVSNTSHNVPLPLMLNHTSGPSQICNNEGIAQFQYVSGHHTTTSLPTQTPPYSSTCSALGMVNTSNIGPLGILNINVKEFIQVEPCQPLDVTVVNKYLNKAMAAQARQRRIQINRLKSINGNCKTRY